MHYLFFVTSFGTIPYSYGKGSEFFSSKNGCLDTEKWKNTDSQWALSLTRLLKLHLVTKPPWQYCLSVALCFSGDRVGQNFRFFLLQDHCITLCTRMPFPSQILFQYNVDRVDVILEMEQWVKRATLIRAAYSAHSARFSIFFATFTLPAL